MTARAKVIQFPEVQSPEFMGSTTESAPVTPLTPLHAGEFSFGELPQVSAEIDEDHLDQISAGRTGNVRWQIVEHRVEDGTKQGTRFQVAHLEPKKRKTDIVLTTGTCWGTQIPGYNMHRALSVAKLGMPVRLIGPEINTSIPLPQSAFNALTYMQYDDQGPEGFGDPKYAVLEGFSRKAMILFGMNAYAAQFGRIPFYNDSTDPCLAKHIKDLSFREYMGMASYVRNEVVGGAGLIGDILRDSRRRRHYLPTVDVSLQGAGQLVRTGLPLFNGDAGLLAFHTPTDMHMLLRFLKGSMPNQRWVYKSILEGRPNIYYDDKNEVHSGGAKRETIEELAQRMSGLVLQLAAKVKPEEIDYSLVYTEATKAAA